MLSQALCQRGDIPQASSFPSFSLQVVTPQDGYSFPHQAECDRVMVVPWSPDARLQTPPPGLAPGACTGCPDLSRVMQVVREQIVRVLAMKPLTLDQLKVKLYNLSYSEILRLRHSERVNQDDFHSAPIIELRERIQPEILELIKQQRLNRLCEGSCFRKLAHRRRQEKFWFCRLSLNHKVLHYGDLDESPQGEVPFEMLTDKIPVCDIKSVVTGKDCPHMKEKSALKQNKDVLELAFSILYDPDEALNFVAPSKYEYCIWMDGLSVLMGKEMCSDLTRSDLDTLISMEMKLRLLDLENISIPEAPPPIPKEPSSYNFTYNYG
ncbi:engulfment and cell motility protein 2 isoform X2 [Ictalurus furcatus]|uniref:engulfment and cell motility protein 2 isoform X2 n=1 Tax=Ictalurus furcatus TaxID=66913 RepID=UPI0023500797|nr:engulfment and cell motility protein 2 isoform X2 [Ictalurus furcatus]